MRTFKSLLLASSLLAAAPGAALAAPGDIDNDGVADGADAFPCDPSAVASVFAPGENQHGLLLFEDQWPVNGDLDFNDVAVAYNYVINLNAQGQATSLQLTLNTLALGGQIANDIMLRLPVPASAVGTVERNFKGAAPERVALEAGEPEAVVRLVADVRSLFPANASTVVNTRAGDGYLPAKPLNVVVRFRQPVALSAAAAPFDVFLARTGSPGHQVHLPQYAGTARMDAALFGTADDGSTANRHFVNRQGLPFALNVPSNIAWPREWQSIEGAYPDIIRFAASAGGEAGNWYATNVNRPMTWLGSTPMRPPQPLIIGPAATDAAQCPAPLERVLVVAAEDDFITAQVRNGLAATGRYASVDAFNATEATPTSEKLAGYTAVLTWSNWPYQDTEALGNALGTYYKAGGRVVTAPFAESTAPWALGGEFGRAFTLIATNGGYAYQSNGALGAVLEPTSPLLVGVRSFVAPGAYYSTGALRPGAVVVARWNFGVPLLVRGVANGRNRADLNFYPAPSTVSPGYWSGDGYLMMANALDYR
jgi:LruC domain-containing protein